MSDDKIILKPREPFDEVLLAQNSDELAKFMDEPLAAIAESITGALAAGPRVWMAMTGHIVQGILKGRLYQEVGREIKELREKGKIPDDYADEKKHRYGFKSWVELLTAIEEEAPDADKLDALKAMFYAVNKIGVKDSECVLSYQLFQIAKRLTSAELMLLRAVNDAYSTGRFAQSVKAPLHSWALQMATRLGHYLPDLVIRDQDALVKQGLISPILDMSVSPHQVKTPFVEMQHARITTVGIRFCENLRTYHLEKPPADKQT